MVPGPHALPLLGGMLQLRSDPLARIKTLRASYGGFLRLGPLGRRELYLLTEPAAIRHVLLDNYKNYAKGLNAQRLRPILGNGSLLLEGEAWRRRRRLVQPAFHKQKIASLTSSFVEATDQMIARWGGRVEIDAREEMLRLTMGLTLRNMFGADASQLATLVDAWHVLYDTLSRSRPKLVRLPAWIPDRERERTMAAKHTVHRALDALIRKSSADDGTVLAMLIAAREEETQSKLSEDELRDEVMTIFVGGYETSSNALAFAISSIAGHPEVAARHARELDAVLGDRPPALGDLERLPYNRAILDETLRRYPPSWMITREALGDDTITGFRIAAGSQLLISAYGVHHAPELWPQPDSFRPERFLADAPERPRFSYLPFGGGPRICLGDQYALTEMQLVLARLGQRFTVSLAPGVEVEPQAQVGLRPRYPLRIRLRRRGAP